MYSPFTPSKIFPPVEEADEYGFLCAGGDLTPSVLTDAYTHGIFPWPFEYKNGEYLTSWFSPDPRCIFDFNAFHIPRRLAQTIRSGKFEITIDKNFEEVIRNCAETHSRKEGTWITPELQNAFINLHKLGIAHSVETMFDGQLAGGIYGLAINGFFAGESMFSLQSDTSKAALVFLTEHLQKQGFLLFDIQIINHHTKQFGAVEISRSEYLQQLHTALQKTVQF
ncbi:leucyl/phenylalanyl-tRNA--protein transferase [Planctomycetales bacterium]|nr:leucyl/phenylalanyl-tRNA--protein transferase [Planctomycetales bacterium]